MKEKKKTIFRMFIVPLAVVILVQAAAAFGTLWIGGTSRRLNSYSVGIMEQIVKNRHLILENSMVHRWSDIGSECQTADAFFRQVLKETGIEEQEFLKNEKAKNGLLHSMLEPCITMLRRNGVNGVYMVLADGGEGGRGDEYSGFYFRDLDAFVNPKDYSDLLMVRGDYGFSHELNIPFDISWTKKFNIQPENELSADDFFYKPYRAALEDPVSGSEKLGYWGSIFSLEGKNREDSYQMISYSVPLISESGQVYGVLGVELSLSALNNMLPEKELNLGQQSGYILAEYNDDGSLDPFLIKGAAVKRNVSAMERLPLRETRYPLLYEMEGVQENGRAFYADVVPFAIYDSDGPFAKNNWALVGIQDEEGLFGIGNRIILNVLLVISISLMLGFICIFVLMNHLTRPISDLNDWIRGARKNALKDYRKTNIVEIDHLYDAVSDLTEKQKKAEYAVLEEKERYLAALKSSTDTIFTYNIEDRFMDVLYLETEKMDGEKNSNLYFTKNMYDDDNIHEADRQMLERVFTRLDETFKVHFRYRIEDGSWKWMEISGKTICDESGKKVKVIGSIRNIHEQKTRELMENKATRVDIVTGLYRERIGQRIISAELESGRDGYLALMDLDDFKELNEEYGIDFGDALLEEAGGFILRLKKSMEKGGKRITAVRAGGDEILVWLRRFTLEETRQYFDRFYKMMRQLYETSTFEPTVTIAGLRHQPADGSFTRLTECLCSSMSYCKKYRKGEFVLYSEIPEAMLDRAGEEGRGFNEIASSPSGPKLNIVTNAFNLFERGNRVTPVISLLFARIGRTFKISHIIMADIRWDFNASSVFREWHESEDAEPDRGLCKTTEEVLLSCEEKMLSNGVEFEDKDEFSKEELELLHIPAGTSAGFCLPLYDNRKMIGVISFLLPSDRKRFDSGERAQLQEIVHIIETNVNRERYDLASRAKSDFLSRMSHEIRTPMNAIIGMTEIALNKQDLTEGVEDCLHKIDRSSHYLLSLINDILDMSRIESGKMKLSLGEGSLKELAEEISELMNSQFEAKHIEYEQKMEVSDRWISADFMRLKQVLINLLGNSLKFTQRYGTVTFTMREKNWMNADSGQSESPAEETEIYFSVEDTGVGISKEDQNRIFNAFEQAENSTAASYGGTGLGLSISTRIVRIMGGEIHLESEEGRGSRFTFTLKFKTAAKDEKEEKVEKTSAEADFNGCRVLLVEDNELNTEIARTLLEMNGFQVETADNGLTCMQKFRNSEPFYYDLILMDIRMPIMNGLEAARSVRWMERSDAATVPIIAMTANAFDEDTKKSIDSGMNGHLAKPIDLKELLQVAGRVIKKSTEKRSRDQG